MAGRSDDTLTIDRSLGAWDWGPWLMTVFLGGLAFFVARQDSAMSNPTPAFEEAILVRAPARWVLTSQAPTFEVMEPEYGAWRARLSVQPVSPMAGADEEVALTELSADTQRWRARSATGYRALREEPGQVQTHAARWLWYAEVGEAPEGVGELPLVVVGADVLVRGEGGRYWHIHAARPTTGTRALDEAAIRELVRRVEIR